VADPSEVNDDGDVLVAAAGVTPHVRVDADYLHAVEPGGIIDEDSLAFGQNTVVGGVLRDPESLQQRGPGSAHLTGVTPTTTTRGQWAARA
jgi:hypothetical protein